MFRIGKAGAGGGRVVAKMKTETKPFLAEIDEAKRNPNGWVYRIAGCFRPDERVQKEAIVGAWKVNANGEIVGDFVRNENYDANRWPTGMAG